MQMMLPTMTLFLLLTASAECAHAADTLPPVLPASLSHAGLEHPESLTESLYTIELRSLQDIRMLNIGERAEMFASLRGMDVGLGSRAKLRRLADAPSATVERSTEGLEQDADWASRPSPRAQATVTRRQLQSGGSMDSIALAVTALLGIASYLVQAKISRDVERSQKDSDRAHVDNARAEGKAEKLLARVQVKRASTAPTLDAVAPFTL
jgi:hypothetical protein